MYRFLLLKQSRQLLRIGKIKLWNGYGNTPKVVVPPEPENKEIDLTSASVLLSNS
jgi:hypothetical protein